MTTLPRHRCPHCGCLLPASGLQARMLAASARRQLRYSIPPQPAKVVTELATATGWGAARIAAELDLNLHDVEVHLGERPPSAEVADVG